MSLSRLPLLLPLYVYPRKVLNRVAAQAPVNVFHIRDAQYYDVLYNKFVYININRIKILSRKKPNSIILEHTWKLFKNILNVQIIFFR